MNHISPCNHTESYLTGSTVESMIDKAKELGNTHFAMTDHGTLSSIVRGYNYALKQQIKPIAGLEIFFKDIDVDISVSDISENRIQTLRNNFNDLVNNFYVDDICNTRLPRKSFNFINSDQVIEHVIDDDLMLKNIRKLLMLILTMLTPISSWAGFTFHKRIMMNP